MTPTGSNRLMRGPNRAKLRDKIRRQKKLTDLGGWCARLNVLVPVFGKLLFLVVPAALFFRSGLFFRNAALCAFL